MATKIALKSQQQQQENPSGINMKEVQEEEVEVDDVELGPSAPSSAPTTSALVLALQHLSIVVPFGLLFMWLSCMAVPYRAADVPH